MDVKLWILISVVLSALVTGVFWGPWLAVTRSIDTFTPDVFLAIVQRMSKNLAPVMTILMPAALLSIVPVLIIEHTERPLAFILPMTAFVLFAVALLVTVLIEVPIVKQMMTWTTATLPSNWQQLRDRWRNFHIVRVIASIMGLVLLVTLAIG